MADIMKSADKEFKAAIINMFKYTKENKHNEGTNVSSVKKWKYKKELSGSSNMEKYNI